MTTSQASDSSPGGTRSSPALLRLHEKVQRWIWAQGWHELREIQEKAIEPILAASKDVIISAATAGGKTEAAFLPICSAILGDAGGGVRALCASPLRALINDQFDRLDRLCAGLEIPVHRWHGDVSSGRKEALMKDPSGVLLITPESLEALFVLHGREIGKVFARLSHVVVDELHSFIGNERGRQLESLLHRLELVLRRRVPRIGLSATLGDMGLAAELLRPGGANETIIITSTGGGTEVQLQVRGYVEGLHDETERAAAEPEFWDAVCDADDGCDTPSDASPVTDSLSGERAIAEHLFKTLRGRKSLVFANSRRDVEVFADLLRRRCEDEKLPNEFWPHHGSLAKELREDVEAMLKDASRPTTVLCTSTLEMGIDVGAIESVAQIGAPPSVASLRQRLGRSGRRGSASVLRVYVEEEPLVPDGPLEDALRAELVQTVAMVRLLLGRWVEPPESAALHLSTLVQQVLSTIAQCHGASAEELWRVLCSSGPFSGVAQTSFAKLLRELGRHGLLIQSSDGTLLHGPKGERMVNHYGFYAAFSARDEYRLVADGSTLGSLPVAQAIAPGMSIIFGGRRWRVSSVDVERKVIDVAPSPGGAPPRFGGSGGAVHHKVREEMLDVYKSEDVPAFLDRRSSVLLGEGRATFHRLGLAERSLVPHGKETLLFLWVGDLVRDTIVLALEARGLKATASGLAIAIDCANAERVRAELDAMAAAGPPDPVELARAVANQEKEKYDRYLPAELLRLDYASRALDLPRAWTALRKLRSGSYS